MSVNRNVTVPVGSSPMSPPSAWWSRCQWHGRARWLTSKMLPSVCQLQPARSRISGVKRANVILQLERHRRVGWREVRNQGFHRRIERAIAGPDRFGVVAQVSFKSQSVGAAFQKPTQEPIGRRDRVAEGRCRRSLGPRNPLAQQRVVFLIPYVLRGGKQVLKEPTVRLDHGVDRRVREWTGMQNRSPVVLRADPKVHEQLVGRLKSLHPILGLVEVEDPLAFRIDLTDQVGHRLTRDQELPEPGAAEVDTTRRRR